MSYLRVSGKAQIEGDGFARQRAAIKDFAATTGVDLVEEFVDEGVSGTKPLVERPGLSSLLASVLGNGVRIVIVEKADRLARDLIEAELILRELAKVEVRVFEAEDGNDLTAGNDANPTAKLIRQVLGAVSEFEKSGLVAKMRVARDRIRAEQGRCEGPRPYGELAGEVEGLARIRQLSRKPRGKPRRSLAQIAAVLNAEGVPTRGGGPWSRSSVQAVLRRIAAT